MTTLDYAMVFFIAMVVIIGIAGFIIANREP
jgi:hypothetical protein